MNTWKVVALNHAATIERDIVDASAIENGTIYVGLENIQSGGGFVDVREVGSGELASSKFAFTPQHLLYGKLRPYLAKIARPQFSGICSTDILPILPGPELDRNYLAHFLLQPNMVAVANSRATGANLPRLSPRGLAEIKVPLPPLPEQQRIAEILDRADALRIKRRAALAELDVLVQSIFLEMFGDPATNPKGWPAKLLGDVARNVNNGVFRKNPEYLKRDGRRVPVVWVEELFRRTPIDTRNSRRLLPTTIEIEKYSLYSGDILFCRSSLKLKGIAYSNVFLGDDGSALFECHLIRVSPRLDQISPVYLNSLLRLPQMRAIAISKGKTATMTTIDQAQLCSILVMLPPLRVQREFASRVEAVDKLRATHQDSLAELDALFASLQHLAFRGEL